MPGAAATASVTVVPPGGAGMSSVDGERDRAVRRDRGRRPGDSVTVVGASVAPSTRTSAVFGVPRAELRGHRDVGGLRHAVSGTFADVVPSGTVTLPPATRDAGRST